MYSMLADTVELHVENMFGAVMLIRILIPHGSALWKSSWIRIGMKHIFLSGRLCGSRIWIPVLMTANADPNHWLVKFEIIWSAPDPSFYLEIKSGKIRTCWQSKHYVLVKNNNISVVKNYFTSFINYFPMTWWLSKHTVNGISTNNTLFLESGSIYMDSTYCICKTVTLIRNLSQQCYNIQNTQCSALCLSNRRPIRYMAFKGQMLFQNCAALTFF